MSRSADLLCFSSILSKGDRYVRKEKTPVSASVKEETIELSDDQLDVVSGGVAGLNLSDPTAGQGNPDPVADGQAGPKPVIAILDTQNNPFTLTFSVNPNSPDKMQVYHYVNGAWHIDEKNIGPSFTVTPTNNNS